MVERPQTPAPVVVGMVIEERWRLEGAIGSGGMAEVFRATDLHTGRPVAVKVLRGSLESSPEAVQRFRREGELLVRLKNPAIVAADAIASLPDGRLYMVMELLEGETLGARLKRGPMSAADLAPIVAGCAVALAAAHAFGVVHRDLKPDNVFLARRPDGSVQVKLLDFGVSKVFNGEKLTQTGQVLGTPRYMSPEQLGAEPEVDHRVDLYSLGVILYEALSGRSPFLASTPTDLIVAILHGKAVPLRSVRPDVPAALEAVVMRAMAKVRDARHRAATELAEAFFEAAGIDARARPAQRHGMATTPLGAMRASPDASPLDEARPVATADESEGALKVGTFSSFEAIDIDRVLSAHATAPAPVGIGAQLGAPDPRSAHRLAAAAAATALAPAGPSAQAQAREGLAVEAAPAASRREIPATTLSPIVPAVEPAAGSTRREAWAGGRLREDPSGAAPHESARTAYPGRVSRSSSASIGGAYAPRAAADEKPERSQGLLLVAVGLVAGALTAGLVVAILTWVTQMSPGEGRTPPPPPPPAALEDAALGDAGPEDATPSGATAAATGAVSPSGATRTAGAAEDGRAGAVDPGSTSASSGASTPSTETASAETASGAGSSGAARSGSTSSGGGRPPTSRGGSSGSGAAASDEAASSAAATLTEATRALGRGDYAECVDILDDVIARGGTPVALRRRADCLMRMGEIREATRDYQRFCRLAPDHPGISEVRGILAGMGATCP